MGEVIGAVCILESGRCIAKLYQSGTHAHINWDEEVKSGMDGLSCFGFMNDGSTGRPNAAPFAIVEGLDGDYALRINETTRYVLEYGPMTDGNIPPAAIFQNEGDNLKCDRNGLFVSFQYVNYLGRSRIRC